MRRSSNCVWTFSQPSKNFRFLFIRSFPFQICDSDDAYTPLQRPGVPDNVNQAIASASNVTKMEDASELDESLAEQSSDSSESETDLRTKSKSKKLR